MIPRDSLQDVISIIQHQPCLCRTTHSSQIFGKAQGSPEGVQGGCKENPPSLLKLKFQSKKWQKQNFRCAEMIEMHLQISWATCRCKETRLYESQW